jgi:hypothetical protein
MTLFLGPFDDVITKFYCRFAALEHLDTEVEINSAWEIMRKNIKISAKEGLGYYELKEAMVQ